MDRQESNTSVSVPRRPLLQTKLSMPRVRANPVARPRLVDKLNQSLTEAGSMRSKLSLVMGPAGYGKTTLVSQWINQRPQPTAWLSLDRGDNDEGRFLAHFFAAVAKVQEEIGEAAMARLTTTYLYNDVNAILTSFVNDLAVCDETVIVVLDDYHLIENEAVHDIVRFLLQHMPLQLHLVITSRTQPPLPLSLLRARNTLTRINARDLQFTDQEAVAFMQATMGLNLTERQIRQLNEQVEGWITGYQLVALALQEEVALQEAFSGNQRYLVDYLADQVLDQQPEELQEFLLRTAVLPQFNISLCEQVTGLPCREMLRQIEAANLFLIPLDAERRWYRYHHLFADFLTGRLRRRKEQAEIEALHRRAAEWYRRQEQPLIAVDHALAAGDHEMAAELMSQAGRELLMYGEGSTLRGWLETLPDDVRESRPSLRLFFIWALIRTRELEQAADELEAVSELLDDELHWGEWMALRARLAVLTGNTEVNIKYSQKALAKLPADQHMLRSEIAINLGLSHLQQADLTAAQQAFAEAAQNRTHDPGLWAVMFANFYWGIALERQAKPQQAFAIYQRGLDNAAEMLRGQKMSPAVGFMHVGLGQLLFEWNRLAEAETHLRQALYWSERSGDVKMLYYSRESLARLLAANGAWDEAYVLVDAIEDKSDARGLSALRAELALLQRNLAVATVLVDKKGIGVNDPEEKVRKLPFLYLHLIKVRLMERNFAGLRRLVRVLTTYISERNNERMKVEMYLLDAIVHAAEGDMATANQLFLRSLVGAEPAGYRRLFLDYASPTLNRLLHQAAGNGLGADYARSLLSDLQQQDEPILQEIQPLSPRELEVLSLLAQGLSNRSIAEQMVVSLNTVKAHTRRLYEKLDVNSRSQAVARARTLHLLDSE